MSAACALAEAGFRVQLVERRGYLGGRASSYLHPGVNEVIDNCQHVLFGCCTNLIGFYRRIGVADQIHWTSEMTMIEPGGRRSRLGPFAGVARAAARHCRSCSARRHFHFADKLALARAFTRHDAAGAEPTRPKSRWAMAAAQRADRRRDQPLLAAGDCQRAECGHRRHRSALRGQGDSRAVHEFRAKRAAWA